MVRLHQSSVWLDTVKNQPQCTVKPLPQASRIFSVWEAKGWIAGGRGYFGRLYLHFPILNTRTHVVCVGIRCLYLPFSSQNICRSHKIWQKKAHSWVQHKNQSKINTVGGEASQNTWIHQDQGRGGWLYLLFARTWSQLRHPKSREKHRLLKVEACLLKIPLQRQPPTDTKRAFRYPSHYKYYFFKNLSFIGKSHKNT